MFEVCNVMTDESLGEAIDRLAVINDMMLEMNGEECLDYTYESFLEVRVITSLLIKSHIKMLIRMSVRRTGAMTCRSCGGRGCGRPAQSLAGIRQQTRPSRSTDPRCPSSSSSNGALTLSGRISPMRCCKG